MNILETGGFWLEWGAAIIPITFREKTPEINPWKQYQSELPTDTELQRWFRTDYHNIALVTGHNGLTVIDFDNQAVYQEWLRFGDHNRAARMVQKFTYQVETAKGRHVYVRLPQETQSRALTKKDGSRWGIDIKSKGGYVLIPPSIHPDGPQYRAINAGAPVLCVEALSDIIPAEMLTKDNFQPKGKATVQQTLDPWTAAMNPPQMGPGTVARIKARYHLEDILPILSSTGQDFYMTRCPLHDDHNPSMWVNTDKQICGCYAGCTSIPLDFINLYARIHDLTNQAAIVELSR